MRSACECNAISEIEEDVPSLASCVEAEGKMSAYASLCLERRWKESEQP